MKIQCNVCHVAEASVFCCADEAGLCSVCDQDVHDANKLAGKHQRVPLTTEPSQIPKCDICQEALGYFFCLEDRALLCRKCDVAIHSVNTLVSGHKRFLLTGVRAGVDATKSAPSSSSVKMDHHSGDKISGPEEPCNFPKNTPPVPLAGSEHTKDLPVQDGLGGEFSSTMLPLTGGSPVDNTQPWQFDDLLELGDYTQDCNLLDNDSSKVWEIIAQQVQLDYGPRPDIPGPVICTFSSDINNNEPKTFHKADNGKIGDSDGSSFLQSADVELEGDGYMGLVPDSFWAVPDIHSPPTSSGLHWPQKARDLCDPSSFFVPDIGTLPRQNLRHCHDDSKRRRSV